MKILFILAFATSLSLSPAILAKRARVPEPKFITFSKKTSKFIKYF